MKDQREAKPHRPLAHTAFRRGLTAGAVTGLLCGVAGTIWLASSPDVSFVDVGFTVFLGLVGLVIGLVLGGVFGFVVGLVLTPFERSIQRLPLAAALASFSVAAPLTFFQLIVRDVLLGEARVSNVRALVAAAIPLTAAAIASLAAIGARTSSSGSGQAGDPTRHSRPA